VRVAFALLLFANIAWYGWTHWVASPDAVPATAAAPEGRGLQLAREASPSQATVPTAQGPNHCLSLGPFTDLTDAARASTLLRAGELEPRQRAGEGVVWKGFWVTLEGLARGVDGDGALLLEVGGARRRILSGEVSVRPVR